MENYAFILVDEADLLAAQPERADVASLADWAIGHGAKWAVLRQRPTFLWEAIARADAKLGARLGLQERISRARIGGAWSTVEDVGYFDRASVVELGPLFAAFAAEAGDDPAYLQLTETLAETFEVAAQRRMCVLVFRA